MKADATAQAKEMLDVVRFRRRTGLVSSCLFLMTGLDGDSRQTLERARGIHLFPETDEQRRY
jgi:hypothetical protein